MQSYEGIYENGVVRPLTPLVLPESTPVSIIVATDVPSGPTQANASSGGGDAIYEILSRRYNSGHSDTAARHNEHQP